MKKRLVAELNNLWKVVASLDRQTAVVLTLAAALGMWKYTFGSRRFFTRTLAEPLGVDGSGLWGYLYLFATQGITGLLVPVIVLLVIFRRKPRDMGLGLGDWKLGLTLMALYLPVVTVGCWVLSAQGSFQRKYPLFKAAAGDWQLLLIYELLFLLYWVGWEYLWRGFVLFGTRHTFGHWAIIVQMLPFAALHAHKPMAEAYLSILGGLVLGAIVYRCRSFWIAVPIHSFQMVAMDLFCVLRKRTGASGIGLDALGAAFG